MSNIILDYSDYYEDKYEYSREGQEGNIEEKMYNNPNDINNFFKKRGYCPFCGKEIPKVYNHTKHDTIGIELWAFYDVWECDNCGWWEYLYRFSEERDYDTRVSTNNWDIFRHGIIKKFNVSDKQIPINTLMNELLKKQDILYDIDPYKLEDIAQIVFSSYYDCEVKHVGRLGMEERI